MCRSATEGGRRCPHGSDGSRGCEYFDERIKKSFNLPDPPQKFPTIHKENVEELSQQHSKEVLDAPVKPEEFENFKRVVNKMINNSEMSDHDKMIARKQWNRAQKEVDNDGVSQVTLSSWQRMLVGSGLLMADKMGSNKAKIQWRKYSQLLKTSFSVREFGDMGETRILPYGYDTEEEFLEDLERAEQEDNDTHGWFSDEELEQEFQDGENADSNDEHNSNDEEYDEATENARYIDEQERQEYEQMIAEREGTENHSVSDADISFLPEETPESKKNNNNA